MDTIQLDLIGYLQGCLRIHDIFIFASITIT